VPPKTPKMYFKFPELSVNPKIQKSETVEALNVNKYVNQSKKAVGSGTEIEQCSIRLQKPMPVKTHAPESGVEFLVPVSRAFVRGL